MTTCASDVAQNVKPKKKRQMPRMFSANLRAAVEDSADEFVEAFLEGTGGKDYLAALFANGVLGKRTSKKGGPEVESTVHRGEGKYADRKHRVTKLGGGQYKVERVK